MASQSSPHGRPAQQLFIVLWLALQLALPLRGFVRDKIEDRGNFTWNMYATDYRCRGEYRLRRPDGSSGRFDHLRAFQRPEGAGRITHRDRLPAFHRWMCETIGAAGDLGALYGRLECTLDDGPPVQLIEPGVDLCTAENYGVRRP